MGQRISINLSEVVLVSSVSVKFTNSILPGQGDGDRDIMTLNAEIVIEKDGNVLHMDAEFDNRGVCTLARDFNRWSDSYEEIILFIARLGIGYSVY